MLVATHQIGFILIMGPWSYNLKNTIQFRVPEPLLSLCLLILISAQRSLPQRNLPGPPLVPSSHNHHHHHHHHHHHQTRAESPIRCFIVLYAFHKPYNIYKVHTFLSRLKEIKTTSVCEPFVLWSQHSMWHVRDELVTAMCRVNNELINL